MRWSNKLPSQSEVYNLKKNEIVRAAARYFSRFGYHGTTLADVAVDLGVTKQALYYYFSDKQSLLFACAIAAFARQPSWSHGQDSGLLTASLLSAWPAGLVAWGLTRTLAGAAIRRRNQRTREADTLGLIAVEQRLIGTSLNDVRQFPP